VGDRTIHIKMSILICGASGSVGRELCDLFDRENIRYDGTYHRCNDHDFCYRENMFRVDFTNQDEVCDFFYENKGRWSVCVFLIGERNLEKCENDWNATKRINVDAVDNMSALCAKESIYFIYLSSDYVFDGKSHQPYFPSSPVNPIQNYGISKLMAEYRIQKNYVPKISLSCCLSNIGPTAPNYCIIRTPLLYTSNSCTPLHNNAVGILSKGLMDLRYTKAIVPFIPTTNRAMTKYEDDYSIIRPLYIPDLCIFIRVIVTVAIQCSSTSSIISANSNETPKFSGIYHFYNPDNRFTRYEIVKEISKYMNIPNWHIIPYRPSNKLYQELTYYNSKFKHPYDTELLDARYNIHNFFTHTFSETIPHIFSRYKHPKIGICDGYDGVVTNRETSAATTTYFVVFDLDGSLAHTSYAHYRSYLDVFRNRGLKFMTYNEWRIYINYNNFHTYLENVAYELRKHDIHGMEQILSDIQNEKLEAFKIHAALYVTPTKNAIEMLKCIDANPGKINAVIITNNNIETVNIIREIIPELNKITKWCLREPCTVHKPNFDIYTKAKELYYNNEQYIVGVVNTHVGYISMRTTTPIIYLYVDENDEYAKHNKWYDNTDTFIFDDYRSM
jgi:dTDP-4-dehydrorhamnose reductase/FMN phosphatase YigB (HAD superfamily)